MWIPFRSKRENLEAIAYQLKRIADFLEWLKKQSEKNESISKNHRNSLSSTKETREEKEII